MVFMHKLNSSYLFENFIAGKANQLARDAVTQVVDLPGMIYNPLFIYGGHGVGKTHLLQAIGNQIKSKNNQAEICYVRAADYVSDVVRAYRVNRLDKLSQYYQSLDLLLIDDIQNIAGKSVTMRELFITFDSLMDTNKQIVITCDASPESLSGIDTRLISRFSCGLTVSIESPDLKMRAAILLQKAVVMEIPIGEDVAYFVAEHVPSDIRKLEGALNRVAAFARLHERPITVDLANEAIAILQYSSEPADKVSVPSFN